MYKLICLLSLLVAPCVFCFKKDSKHVNNGLSSGDFGGGALSGNGGGFFSRFGGDILSMINLGLLADNGFGDFDYGIGELGAIGGLLGGFTGGAAGSPTGAAVPSATQGFIGGISEGIGLGLLEEAFF